MNLRSKTLENFYKYGVQVEGWLKGEFLSFLDDERASGRIHDFDREVRLETGSKVDFRVRSSVDRVDDWIELKHWLIGRQKGTTYKSGFYFRDPSSVGINPDVQKLHRTPLGAKFVLVLTTANPGLRDWTDGVNDFNLKFFPSRINSLTRPDDFPACFYLGLLHVIDHHYEGKGAIE